MLIVNLENKDGIIWDITEIVSSLTWKTERSGKAGVAKFDLTLTGIYQSKDFKLEEGAVISCTWKTSPVFYGYLFSISKKMDGSVSITAYDQLRYFDMTDTYIIEKKITAAALLKKIANDYGLKTGMIADTKYPLPDAIHDKKKLYDIICTALDQTYMAKYGMFIMYDDFGSIALKNIRQMALLSVIGDKSLLRDFSYESSIDKETYNIVQFIQENKEKGTRRVFTRTDPDNIRKWGNLKYYKSIDEKLNDGQIKDILDATFELYNRKTETLKLDSLGDLNIRAGCFIWLEIEDLQLSQYMLVESCEHKFAGDEHMMSLTMRVVRNDAVNSN